MQSLICGSCGSNDFEKVGRFYVCRYCGTKMLSEVPEAASIDRSGRIADLLKRADLYWRHNRKAQAASLYRQILELDASCAIAKQRINGR